MCAGDRVGVSRDPAQPSLGAEGTSRWQEGPRGKGRGPCHPREPSQLKRKLEGCHCSPRTTYSGGTTSRSVSLPTGGCYLFPTPPPARPEHHGPLGENRPGRPSRAP